MNRFMLGAYWDARADTLEKCSDDLLLFFARLVRIDPLLMHWYERGRSREEALRRKVDTSDAKRLRDLLLERRSRRDLDGEIVEDLGFRVGLWNGASEDGAEASVDIHCGCYSDRIGNNVLIDLPCNGENPKWIDNASTLLAMIAEIWRPKWAGIMSKKAMIERMVPGVHPFVDWMVYVPRSVHPMFPPSRVEVLNGLGSIVVVQPDPPVGDPDELSRIRRVERLLTA